MSTPITRHIMHAARSSATPEQPTRRPHLVYATLAVWAMVLVLVCGYLLASHLLTLPQPSRDNPILMAAIDEGRTAQERDGWMLVHVFYGDCGCSRRLADYLLERGRSPDAHEKILLVGEYGDFARRAEERGFIVEPIEPEALKTRYNIEGVPLLIVADGWGRLRYVGGYTSRKQGPDIQDVAIFRAVQEDRVLDSLPLFGCATSQELREALNPLEAIL